jgi:serine/threonine protein kinase
MSLVSKNINGYDITKSLGAGAFGEVYIGEKKGLKYVLKFIKIAQGLDKNNQYKNNVLSIITEIYALKKITENNEKCGLTKNNSSLCLIETFINFDSKPPTFCIVTNYLENAIELSKVIYKRTDYVLKLDDIIFIMSKLISQLTQLHHYNIVHSDIKPENIIVQTNNIDDKLKEIHNVLFIDYGISCLENCLPGGTLSYAAPEILPIIGNGSKERLQNLRKELHDNKLSSNNKSYKIYNDKYKIPFSKEDYKKTDVYSLGVTFYKLLNNRYPYPFQSDYKKPKSLRNSRKNSKQSNNSNESDESDESYSQSETEYYEYPEDVIRDFQNQIPLLNYYHKHNSLIPSNFSLSENNDVNMFLNKIVDSMLTLNPLKRPTISQIKTSFDAFKKEFRSNYETREDLYTPNANSLLSLDTSPEKLFSLNKFRLNSPSTSSLLKLNEPPVPKKRNSSINLSESMEHLFP